MLNCLVTGADGFLGRHFLAGLAARGISARAMLMEGTPVSALPGGPEIVHADLRKPETLDLASRGVTHVIHLAARVHMMNDPTPDPAKAFFEVNTRGTAALLEAAAKAGATHFLLMSTVKAMGEQERGEFDERTAPRPADPYGRSKLAAENILFDFARSHGMHAVALRLPLVYGPGAKGNVLRLLDAARAGRRLPFGAIENRRSMLFVDNVVQAAFMALENRRSRGEVYLVSDDRPYSTREFYGAICHAMGKPPLLRSVPHWTLKAMGMAGSVLEVVAGRRMPINVGVVRRISEDFYFSTEKIRSQLQFRPAVSLDEGVRRTVEWYVAGCPPTPRA